MRFRYWLLAFFGYMMLKLKHETEYDPLIKQISNEHDNSPHLVKALIKIESNFNPKAHNLTKKEDSRGLGQVNVPTAKLHGVTDYSRLYEPELNIDVMNKIIDDLKTRYEDFTDIIAAYNAGRVITKDGKYINSEYVFKVYSYYLLYNVLG
ncbi:hypothetical protein ES702_04956 [subsurface metagenome]